MSLFTKPKLEVAAINYEQAKAYFLKYLDMAIADGICVYCVDTKEMKVELCLSCEQAREFYRKAGFYIP